MATSYVRRNEWITTSDSAAVSGAPFKVDGNLSDLQILVAPSNFTIHVSMDGTNWIIGTDADGNNLTALGAGVYRIKREAPFWVRAQVASDQSAPRNGIWWIGTQKSI